MIRPIATLNNVSNESLNKLNKEGYFNVEDLLKSSEDLKKYNLNKVDIENREKVFDVLALDIWQNETQRDSVSLCFFEKEGILINGIQCGVITELTGAPFSGKTQICMQLCVSAHLNKCYGGLNGRSIYIDTRSGTSVLRFRDILQGYNNYFQDLNLTVDEVFKNIDIFSPQSIEEFLQIIDSLKDHAEKIRDNKKVRLLIVDSLSMPILCCIDDPLRRPYYYSRILYKLNKLTLNNDLAIVITNEMIMQVDMDGKSYLAAAGGQYIADYAVVKLESTRLTNNKFGIRILKSPIMPEISETFMITETGINTSRGE